MICLVTDRVSSRFQIRFSRQGKLGSFQQCDRKSQTLLPPNLVALCLMYYTLHCPSCSSSPLADFGQSNSPPCRKRNLQVSEHLNRRRMQIAFSVFSDSRSYVCTTKTSAPGALQAGHERVVRFSPGGPTGPSPRVSLRGSVAYLTLWTRKQLGQSIHQ
jgi:hypothetical protein